MSVIIWLWMNAIHPLWFWALLLFGIIPFVLIGSQFKKHFTILMKPKAVYVYTYPVTQIRKL